MMTRFPIYRHLFTAALLVCTLTSGEAQIPGPDGVVLSPFAGGFSRPVEITHAGDGRLFVVEQAGRIRIFQRGAIFAQPFLDITSRVSCCGERGLLGLAFPPDFAVSGFFFVNYTNLNGNTVIARYRLSASSPDRADPGSETIVLTIPQPFSNHNGGQLRFGPDGMLWIGMGDGGSGGDPMQNGQSLDTLLGKLLRIDVSQLPYGIPSDNPFVGQPGTRPEIWSYGWRNPWRFSFDSVTEDLFVGDVGQNQWEEIDHEPASAEGGRNYGWRLMEGAHCFNPPSGCNDGTLVLPIAEYDHSQGCSITAGFRYRGRSISALEGVYIYGDFCSGRIWGARETAEGWTSTLLMNTPLMISAFGQDPAGELYVADYSDGVIYRFRATSERKRAVRRP